MPTSGGGFARVDMANDDHVDMHLLFTVIRVIVSRVLMMMLMTPRLLMDVWCLRKKSECVPHCGGSFRLLV